MIDWMTLGIILPTDIDLPMYTREALKQCKIQVKNKVTRKEQLEALKGSNSNGVLTACINHNRAAAVGSGALFSPHVIGT